MVGPGPPSAYRMLPVEPDSFPTSLVLQRTDQLLPQDQQIAVAESEPAQEYRRKRC